MLVKVMNRDELLNSLEDIAEAFDMRVRPYSATSGQTLFPQLLLLLSLLSCRPPFRRLLCAPDMVCGMAFWNIKTGALSSVMDDMRRLMCTYMLCNLAINVDETCLKVHLHIHCNVATRLNDIVGTASCANTLCNLASFLSVLSQSGLSSASKKVTLLNQGVSWTATCSNVILFQSLGLAQFTAAGHYTRLCG